MGIVKKTLPRIFVLASILFFWGCSTLGGSSSLSASDKKNLNSVHGYLLIVESNLGKWDNLEKAEENLEYAKKAFAELSPFAVSSGRGIEYALKIKNDQREINNRKKDDNS